MKKALMYASVASMIQQFNMDNIRLLIDCGYQVDVACNMEVGSTISDEKIAAMKKHLEDEGVKVYHIPVPRKITAVGNIFSSLSQTKKLMNENGYDLIHCHSPIGGMVCRIANRLSRYYKKSKMIYTAHGFHFFRGAPKINWLMFYPVERICALLTDVLITINKEDYARAKKFRLKKNGIVEYVPGIGINPDKLSAFPEKREEICTSLGIPTSSILMLSVGELNDNKNQGCVVAALPSLPENYHYLICGQGPNKDALEAMAEQSGCAHRLHVLGYRDDVPSMLKSCDMFIFPSKREGLSVALMEAMSCGMICFVSDIRGNSDLISDGAGGVRFKVDTFTQELIQKIGSIDDFAKYKEACKAENQQKIKGFSRDVVKELMRSVYVQQ